MPTNFALQCHQIGTEAVRMTLLNSGPPVRVSLRRIDDHANAKRKCQGLGTPEYLSASDLAELNAASMRERQRQDFTCRDGAVDIATVLVPLSVTAITLSYAGPRVA